MDIKRLKKFLGLSLFLFILFYAFPVFSQEETVLYFFYGEGCPHCAQAEIFLEKLQEKYPQIKIESYEVFSNKDNAKLLSRLFEACGESSQIRVPATFIGNKVVIEYLSEEITGVRIENILKECLENGCQNSLEKLKECQHEESVAVTEKDQVIHFPVIGLVNLSKMSLPVLTITVGALDGLNPCAMWVLLFLIALLLNTHSRKRMLLIGGTFIIASGVIYYLLLAAWLNLFLAISYVNLTRNIIGIFALGVGAWQIRNFIKFRPGVCKVTDGKGLGDKIKNGFKNRSQKLANAPLTFGILISIIILAFGVNLVEFFCSAGLPAIYTRILVLNNLSPSSYYLYLLLYSFIFMLDDLIIFLIAFVTLSKIGFTEKYNYWTTLIGGLIIFI
ncbi:hypothetical protein E3V08_01155, partial [Candidatus Atribacteria bacterium MT.SAG.1]